jgi:hypothetical protein
MVRRAGCCVPLSDNRVFTKLANKSLLGRFTRFDMATRKTPAAGIEQFIPTSLAEQNRLLRKKYPICDRGYVIAPVGHVDVPRLLMLSGLDAHELHRQNAIPDNTTRGVLSRDAQWEYIGGWLTRRFHGIRIS